MNYSYFVTNGAPAIIDVPNSTATIIMSSPNPTTARLLVINPPKAIIPNGYSALMLLNISVFSPQKINTTIYLKYPCNVQTNAIAAYYFINGNWNQIITKVNATNCLASFNLTTNKIVSVLQNRSAASTTTTIIFSTIPIQVQTNVSNGISNGIGSAISGVAHKPSLWWIGAVIAVIIIIIAFYMLKETA